MKILVTGGAGFIGSHLVDALVKARHTVTVLDNLDPQVHGAKQRKPSYLNPKAIFVRGDVRDLKIVKKLIKNQDILFHKAAAVGVAQSMYEIARYTDSNTMGAATILQAVADGNHQLKKIIVASTMSLYGEGRYTCQRHGVITSSMRPLEQLNKQQWEMTCPQCRKIVKPHSTPESKTLSPTSIYAINKRDHEEMFMLVGRTYNIPTVTLRYFNAYGTRQALSNPYTGAAAIFSSAMLNNISPHIFEDGKQSRDFVHVKDIVQANLLVMRKKEANFGIFNVGTGRHLSIIQLASKIARELNFKKGCDITHTFRAGDIRHCFANIRKIKKLGYQPRIRFEDGLKELCHWVATQHSSSDSVKAHEILLKRGLSS